LHRAKRCRRHPRDGYGDDSALAASFLSPGSTIGWSEGFKPPNFYFRGVLSRGE
jgi:hypothetical protein